MHVVYNSIFFLIEIFLRGNYITYFSPDSVCRKGNMELMEKEEETKFLNMEVSDDGETDNILVSIFGNVGVLQKITAHCTCTWMNTNAECTCTLVKVKHTCNYTCNIVVRLQSSIENWIY